jgi:hypothetical protein
MEEKNLDSKLEESETIELEKVRLRRSWSFWENYESLKKSGKEYSQLLKEIYTFDNIISFWQFWNKYPGSDIRKIFYDGEYVKYFFKEKYRIVAINIFVNGIKPEWEDKNNKEGNILTLEYVIDKDLNQFLSMANDLWIKLIIILIGETIPYSNNINGIRFVDKTKLNKSVIFKFEVWANKLMQEKELEKIKLDLSKSFGCKGTIKKIRKHEK